MTNFYIIDAARYPLVLSEGEELPKGLYPILAKTKYKGSKNLGPYLMSKSVASHMDEWFFTEDLYDVICFRTVSDNHSFLLSWFRELLDITTEDGHKYFFRYFDSRVLKQFLPTCDEQQLEEFFKPFDAIIMYNDDYLSASEYQYKNGKLEITELDFEKDEKKLGLKKIKFPLPMVSQLKCINKLKGSQNALEMTYGTKLGRIEKLIESGFSIGAIHAEIERITGQTLTAESFIDNNSKEAKGRMSKLRAKSFAIANEQNKMINQAEMPVKKAQADLRAANPLRKAQNLKNQKTQDLQTKANKARLKSENKLGINKAETKISKAKSTVDVQKHRLNTADNKLEGRIASKVSKETSIIKDAKDIGTKPTSINQGITKVNKLHKMASDFKKDKNKKVEKEEKLKDVEKESESSANEKIADKRNTKKQNENPPKKWTLDF